MARQSCFTALLLATTALLLPHAAAAQIPDRSRLYQPAPRPPGIRYQVLSSEHFRIIFEDGAYAEARAAAAILERELPGTQALTGHARTMRMPVVLNAYNDRSNGLVTTLPFRQEIETAGIQGSRLSARYTSWMQAVAPHELVHAAQADAGGEFGVGTVLRWVSPDLARSLNLGLPPGLSEGAAVYYESSLEEGAGRLNFAQFQMKIRAAMASGRPWTLAQMLEAPAYTYPADRHYSGGANLFAHLAASDDGAFFRKVRALHYRFPFLGTGLELWHGTGTSPWRLGRAVRQAMQQQESTRLGRLGDLVRGRPIVSEQGWRVRRPQWLTDSTVVVYASGYNLRTGFYVVNITTRAMRPLAFHAVTGDGAYSVASGGSVLLFSRYVRSRHVATQWVADAFRLDMASGRAERLTRGKRVFFPVDAGTERWAIQNRGQFTRWVRLRDDEAEPVAAWPRSTIVQLAPAPDGREVALVLRQGGRQGIWRASWPSEGAPDLEPWIVFRDASVYDIFWHGQDLFFAADLGGVSNIYCATVSGLVQLTNVPFGAMEPSISPDASTLAYVEYGHERYELRVIPFDLALARPVAPAMHTGEETSAPLMPAAADASHDAPVPYRPLRYLAPRTLLPSWTDSGDGTVWSGPLGFGPGMALQGADPLRRWTYSLGAHYQAARLWVSMAAATHVHVLQTDIELYSKARAASVLYRDHSDTVLGVWGQAWRGVRLNLSLPVFLESNVRSTSLHLRLEQTLAQNRLIALPGTILPQLPRSWRTFQGRYSVGPAALLRYRISRNTRDLMPNSGSVLNVSSDLDLWDGRAQPRRAVLARLGHYWSLSKQYHTGLRIQATLVAQNRAQLYSPSHFAPRGFEDGRLRSRTYYGVDALAIQPLWFADNGLVIVPVYLKVLYAYAFAEALFGHRPQETYRSAGAGLGLDIRVAHHINLQLRVGGAYHPGSRQIRWTFR